MSESKKEEIVRLFREGSRPARTRRGRPRVSVVGSNNLVTIAQRITIRSLMEATAPAAITKARAIHRNTWREELESQIWRRVWDVGLTSEQFFALMSRQMGKSVDSLAKASERDLGQIYELVAKLRRPALNE